MNIEEEQFRTYIQMEMVWFSRVKLTLHHFQRHRVVVPREELFFSKPRQSVVFFVRPDNDVVIESVDGSNHRYPPITALDYTRQRFDATYDIKSEN